MSNRKNAFTLVELLISTAILCVITLSLYSAFATGILSYNRIDSAFNTFQEARIIFNRMELDLKNTFIYSEINPGLQFKGTGKNLSFFSVIDTYEKDKIFRNICRVEYSLSSNSLKRACQYGLGALVKTPAPQGEEISENVKDISFAYGLPTGKAENPIEWRDSWNDKNADLQPGLLPEAVKIKLTLMEKDNQNNSKGIEFVKTLSLPLGG